MPPVVHVEGGRRDSGTSAALRPLIHRRLSRSFGLNATVPPTAQAPPQPGESRQVARTTRRPTLLGRHAWPVQANSRLRATRRVHAGAGHLQMRSALELRADEAFRAALTRNRASWAFEVSFASDRIYCADLTLRDTVWNL